MPPTKRPRAAVTEPAAGKPKSRAPLEDEVKAVLRRAVDRLSIGVVLEGEVPGREAQVRQVMDFVQHRDSSALTLLLFGMPGTGKTCAVKQAVSRLGESAVSALMLNGYMVQRPTDVYVALHRHLIKHRLGGDDDERLCSPEQAANLLEKRFRTLGWGKGKVAQKRCLIVVDELDKCIEKNPKVLYRLVEWLSLPHAHCKLIGIANSMEFPMDAKTRSRLDATSQIVFQPYTEHELRSILAQRFAPVQSRFPIMSQRAVDYICRQTASNYGDARRLLQSTASAVHSVLCALDEGEAVLPSKQELETRGIVDFRHVHAVASRVFQERFRDFVLSIKSGMVFGVVSVIAVENRSMELRRSSGATTSMLAVAALFQRCRELFEAYGPRLGVSDAKHFAHAQFLHILSELRQVAFLELSVRPTAAAHPSSGLHGRNNGGASAPDGTVPLLDAWDVLQTSEDAFVTMTQLPESVISMCQVHDLFGEPLKTYLNDDLARAAP